MLHRVYLPLNPTLKPMSNLSLCIKSIARTETGEGEFHPLDEIRLFDPVIPAMLSIKSG